MRFGIRSTSVENVNDVAAKLITTRRVIFTPSTEIKDELKKTSINITCYDRNGEIVKRVTSTDDSDVEDPDNEPTDPNGGGQQSGGNTQNQTRQYTISVTSADTAQGTVTGGGTYSEGYRVNVTATPKSSFQFDR